MTTIGSNLPDWLIERSRTTGDQSVSQSMHRAFEAGLQDSRENKKMMLAVTQAAIEHRQREAQITGTLLNNLEKANEFEDMQTIEHAKRAYVMGSRAGQTPVGEPPLKSVQGHRVWTMWKSAFEAEQSDTFEYADFLKSYAGLDGRGKAAIRGIGPLQKGALKEQHFLALGEHQARMQDEVIERQLTKAAELTELGIYRDSLKPTRIGQLVHDLPETDLAEMRAEIRALDNMYEKGELKGSKRGFFEGGGTIETAAQEYKRMQQEIFKKYDAKRVGTPRPAGQAVTAPSVPTVTTKEDFDKLPSGTEFIGSDGKRYRKP